MTVPMFRMPGKVLLTILFACLFIVPCASAADTSHSLEYHPHWSVEVKGGHFYPGYDQFPPGKQWADFYGDKKTWQVAGTVAYKVLRMVEIGVEGGMIRDKGQAFAPLNGITTGKVEYQLYPLSAFLLLRGVFNENQWVVPYVGGGLTRMYYQVKVEDQGDVRGKADGYNGRAGLQLLLDGADRKSANKLFLDYGIIHTYLFFEYQVVRAMVNDVSGTSVDLGGKSWLVGLLFEF